MGAVPALIPLLSQLAVAPLVAAAVFLLVVRLARFVLAALVARASSTCVAFYHPHTRDGGGGERVLWCAINAAQAALGSGRGAFIFTGDDDDGGDDGFDLASRGERLFGVPRSRAGVSFIRIRLRRISEASVYPFATLFLQVALGALGAIEVVLRTPLGCATIVDTSGNNPLLIPIARACGIDVVAYVHYPLIFAGIMRRVRDGTRTYNNASTFFTAIKAMRELKWMYYAVIGRVYGASVARANVLMCNSSWTERNLR